MTSILIYDEILVFHSIVSLVHRQVSNLGFILDENSEISDLLFQTSRFTVVQENFNNNTNKN